MTPSICLGLDTSNYTTSVAWFDGTVGENFGRLLNVPSGTLGLRQSEALFQHVKQLPGLFEAMRERGLPEPVAGVGASIKPRWVEESYMPCFLAGESQARGLSQVLGVPFFPCAHQQGHVAAAAWAAGREDLLDRPHLAWHLSGGTTELLYVEPDGVNIRAERIGGTSDISAGQLIDRTGKLLGLDFPAGKALDVLAGTEKNETYYKVREKNLTFSLSGVENQIKALAGHGAAPEAIARYALDTIADVVLRTTAAALAQRPGLPILCTGGVASNRRLRLAMDGAIFAPPRYSTDNALGVAILAWRALRKESGHEK
ncbi:MAG: DNA-binding protein [Intestinimonas sp.]|jgi:N6-L-threonylcarbamoyladenine synthase|nr:DNA-binding protein [Intestinimonas sp.]